MKNLLIYINPKGFDPESEKLTKIQIDNSLELGWDPKDIILVTNFPYDYRSVKATIVKEGGCFCPYNIYSSKFTTIVHLFDIGFIEDHLYWCHDLDAYQLEPISEEELGLENLDAGFTDYGRKPYWQMGCFFFKKTAESIFRDIVTRMASGLDEQRRPKTEEVIMNYLTDNNINNVNSRIKRLNITYNFNMRRVDYCYQIANKPLKVLHFHPNNPLLNTLAIAMYGKNRIKKPLMNERLIKIFNKYGYS